MSKGKFVVVGKGKRLHRRYSQWYTYCGLGPPDDGIYTRRNYPKCKRCELLFQKDTKEQE